MYLFETSFVIDLFRHEKSALKFAKEIDDAGVFKAISIGTYHEMMIGFHYLGDEKKISKIVFLK